jgi:DNA-binding transcriptional regulator YhcF (GntR family)
LHYSAALKHTEDTVASPTRRETVANELRDRIVSGLHVGHLRGGERLSSVRALAAELDVNERVVLAALRALAEEGLVELRERSGAYVVPPHPSFGEGLPFLGRWLITTLVQARTRGLAPCQVSELVRRCFETRHVRAACLECNADQLDLLCTELTDDHGYITDGALIDELDVRDPPLAVRRADVLVTTVFHADKVGRIARALGKPWIAVVLRPDVMRNVARQLERGPVHYIATDRRFERKLRRMLAPFGPTTNLRLYILPGDDLAGIPDDAATFVMPSARRYLRRRYGDAGWPGKPMQPPRHLSDEAARQLLTFLVQLNMAALSPAT